MLQQAQRERPTRKSIRLRHVGGRATKNQSSSPSTMGELIPGAPQAERAIANVLLLPAIPALNPGPDQEAPAMRARKDRNPERHQTTSATLQMWEGHYCPERRRPATAPTLF